jgi:hypothetical protein
LTENREPPYNPARRLRGGSVSTPSREVRNGHEEVLKQEEELDVEKTAKKSSGKKK